MPNQPHLIEKKQDAPPLFIPEKEAAIDEQSEYASEAAAFELYEAKEHVSVPEEDFLNENIQELSQKMKQRPAPRRTTVAQVRDPLTLKIEYIMEDGLVDAFREMTPVQQQEFKIKGEQTAKEIRTMLKSRNGKLKKIFSLLVAWLKLIPGVNRFFIEQEAKIKTDKLFALRTQDIE